VRLAALDCPSLTNLLRSSAHVWRYQWHPADPMVAATRSLRAEWKDLLRTGIVDYVLASSPVSDWRDVLLGLAPLHDCALRLGADPAVVFADAADDLPADVAELARTFGKRSDVTSRAFGFEVVNEPDGPIYRIGPVGAE
jgi:hypothetical protein